MDNVLVTGGTGFVGSWMRKTEPHQLSCDYISRQNYSDAHWWDWHYDYIIHLAPIAPTRVIESTKYSHCRLLYCSSGAAYDQQTEYAKNKRQWEAECLASGVDVVIARLFTFYGEGLDEHKAYTAFIKAAKANKPIEIWGDGSTVRSYMQGREMGEWLWAILLHGESRQVYDVGSDDPITMLQLAEFIKYQMKSKSEIIIKGGTDPAPYYMPHNTAKTKLLLKEAVNG